VLDGNWIKLSAWAKQHGIPYKTAWRLAQAGEMPPGVTTKRLPTGAWFVKEDETQLDRIERKLDDVRKRLK